MKRIATILISLLLPTLLFGQSNQEYSNDSIEIFSALNNKKEVDFYFGNKTNGLERHYRKKDDQWNLLSICFWKNRDYLWCCKVGNYNAFDFNIDLININEKYLNDSITIEIPYENGKTWLLIDFYEKGIRRMRKYTLNQVLVEELFINGNLSFYKKYFVNGIVNIQRTGKFFFGNKLMIGKEKIFNENGELIEEKMVDNSKKK